MSKLKETIMSKIRPGHSQNSKLNGEWGKHVDPWMKKVTSGKRRCEDREIIREELENVICDDEYDWWSNKFSYRRKEWDLAQLEFEILSDPNLVFAVYDSRFFAQF